MTHLSPTAGAILATLATLPTAPPSICHDAAT
jgi:hypothetical protein